jgi:hypothetical protein
MKFVPGLGFDADDCQPILDSYASFIYRSSSVCGGLFGVAIFGTITLCCTRLQTHEKSGLEENLLDKSPIIPVVIPRAHAVVIQP